MAARSSSLWGMRQRHLAGLIRIRGQIKLVQRHQQPKEDHLKEDMNSNAVARSWHLPFIKRECDFAEFLHWLLLRG
jgi:hypothetical protein